MSTLSEKTLAQLLDAFASSDPTPGGGSASALASALGCALAEMVAALPKTRSNTDEERDRLRRAHGTLQSLRARLAALVDDDSAAYDAVVAAYRLPKDTDEQKAARKDRIQQALGGATGVPLDVMRASVAALDAAGDVARDAHRAAASDVGVALALLEAGLYGAALNARINLDAVADKAQAAALGRTADELESKGKTLRRAADELLRRV